MKPLRIAVAALTTREGVGLCLILAVALLLGAFVWHSESQRGQWEAENLSFVHSISPDAVAGVSVSDEHGTPLKTITDSAALASFAVALNSTETYQPNHPYAVSKFQVAVRLKQGEMRRFDAYTMLPADQAIYMDFHPGGNGKSKLLFDWMKAQGFVQ